MTVCQPYCCKIYEYCLELSDSKNHVLLERSTVSHVGTIMNKRIFWAFERAFRPNIFAWRMQKWFPLQSLTQKLESPNSYDHIVSINSESPSQLNFNYLQVIKQNEPWKIIQDAFYFYICESICIHFVSYTLHQVVYKIKLVKYFILIVAYNLHII